MIFLPFPESNHSLLKSLANCNDLDLLDKFQSYPEQGKFFAALFCRYGQVIYSLIASTPLCPVERDYLFALIWREFFYEMRSISLGNSLEPELNSLQNWLIYSTGCYLKEKKLPPVETIKYNLQTAPPPLWCYLEPALDTLTPEMRFILVATDNFHWSRARITAYLQAEGENITPEDIQLYLDRAYEVVKSALPEDIRLIYLDSR